MTGLEKTIAVKNLVSEACSCSSCVDCQFFNPEDATDGQYFCHFRDHNDLVPSEEQWYLNSALLEKAR